MTTLPIPITDRHRRPARQTNRPGMDATVRAWWLGQAGFLIQAPGATVVIDPYLSDSLFQKYRGREFAHKRMMVSPVDPRDLHDVDLILSTHGHTDHLDPGTLSTLAAASPVARFVVARSTRSLAIERGIPEERLATIDASESFQAGVDEARGVFVTIHAVASAHEVVERDESGAHRYLGYIIDIGGLSIYHSGDCVPYDGLSEAVSSFAPDIALLPINGRDAYRSERGVPGNFTVEEAAELATAVGASCLIGHHHGMFEFNTVDPDDARSRFRRLSEEGVEMDGSSGRAPTCMVAESGVCYEFGKGDKA